MTSQKRNGNSLYFYSIDLKALKLTEKEAHSVVLGAQIVTIEEHCQKKTHWESEKGRTETPFFWRLPRRAFQQIENSRIGKRQAHS